IYIIFFLLIRQLPRSTLFPYTTLFRSKLKSLQINGVSILMFCIITLGYVYDITIDILFDNKPGATTESQSLSLSNRMKPVPLMRSEEHTSELQSRENLVCRLLLEKKKR